MSHYLQKPGYRVAMIGKSHVGPRSVSPSEYLGDKAKRTDANKLILQKNMVDPLATRLKIVEYLAEINFMDGQVDTPVSGPNRLAKPLKTANLKK